jgi:hypothetical protein
MGSRFPQLHMLLAEETFYQRTGKSIRVGRIRDDDTENADL